MNRIALEEKGTMDINNDIIAYYIYLHIEISKEMNIKGEELCKDIINIVYHMTSTVLLYKSEHGMSLLYTMHPKFSSDSELISTVMTWWSGIRHKYPVVKHLLSNPKPLDDFPGTELMDSLFYYTFNLDDVCDEDEDATNYDGIASMVKVLGVYNCIHQFNDKGQIIYYISLDDITIEEYNKILFDYYYKYLIIRLLFVESTIYAHHTYAHELPHQRKRRFAEASFQLAATWHIQNKVNTIVCYSFPKTYHDENDITGRLEVRITSEVMYDNQYPEESFDIYPMVQGLALLVND